MHSNTKDIAKIRISKFSGTFFDHSYLVLMSVQDSVWAATVHTCHCDNRSQQVKYFSDGLLYTPDRGVPLVKDPPCAYSTTMKNPPKGNPNLFIDISSESIRQFPN